MVNFCSVTAEIDWWVLGHPSNFQRVSSLGFVTQLLQPRRSTDINQTLHDVRSAISWDGALYMHFGGSCDSITEFCRV